MLRAPVWTLRALTPDHIKAVASAHLERVYRYQRNLKRALDEANTAGEEARRERFGAHRTIASAVA